MQSSCIELIKIESEHGQRGQIFHAYRQMISEHEEEIRKLHL